MAHEVESMFSVKQTPWHGLGQIIENAPTSREAMKLAGLDWHVNVVPIFTEQQIEIPGHYATQRATDGQILGLVKGGYRPLQNSEAFAWFDPFVAAGEATYETAGSLRQGSRVWILAKLTRSPSEIVSGDFVEKFVLLSNGHDGKVSVRAGFTPIRVVCANTLANAHSSAESKLMRVQHSSKVVESLDAVREIMDMADASFEASMEQYRALSRRRINQKDLEKYVNQVFYPGRETPPEGEASPKSRVLESIQRLFEEGRGADIPGVRGTMWGAYNAVTEYLGYERGPDDSTRLNNLWLEDGARLNAQALQYAYQVAA